jgi:erythronate-4-phosphate dehydrogenase
MRIVADTNLVLLNETFGQHGEIDRVSGRDIKAHHVSNADILLLRSVTRADRALLENSGVKFVGTATIGTDHLDTDWMTREGISWAAAPGCNANAAAQYTLAMMLLALDRLGRKISDQSVGIIGHGNVGSRLHGLLNLLGVPVVACDPPLADKGVAGLDSMGKALEQSIVSLHVPLTRHGPYATSKLVNACRLGQLNDHTLLINTSRGGVVDSGPLLSELESGRIQAALDVWPNEPAFDTRLLQASVVASPHVAGYSVEGKQNGTRMVYEAFCKWQGIEALTDQYVPGKTAKPNRPESVVHSLSAACNVAEDDRAMRALLTLNSEERSSGFDRLRQNYRLRHDLAIDEGVKTTIAHLDQSL